VAFDEFRFEVEPQKGSKRLRVFWGKGSKRVFSRGINSWKNVIVTKVFAGQR